MLHSIFLPFGAAMAMIVMEAVSPDDGITLGEVLWLGVMGFIGAWLDEKAAAEERDDA